jgi:hypothetical protein
MFDSLVATSSYVAAGAVSLPGLSCHQVHFALNQNTKQQTLRDYLNWFVALNLLGPDDEAQILNTFIGGGQSTCVLRTSFTEANCTSMFFDDAGVPRNKSYYLDLGRRALRALLDKQDNPNDVLRYRLIDDDLWPNALQIGANVQLGPLVGLSTADARVELLIGDVDVITSWAQAMVDAGACVAETRNFVANADPATLAENNDFKRRRDALQKKLSAMVKASKVRFAEPWGMVCLFWAAGSPRTAYAKLLTPKLTLEKGAQPAAAAAGG